MRCEVCSSMGILCGFCAMTANAKYGFNPINNQPKIIIPTTFSPDVLIKEVLSRKITNQTSEELRYRVQLINDLKIANDNCAKDAWYTNNKYKPSFEDHKYSTDKWPFQQ